MSREFKVLRRLSLYLQAQSREHRTVDHLEERVMGKVDGDDVPCFKGNIWGDFSRDRVEHVWALLCTLIEQNGTELCVDPTKGLDQLLPHVLEFLRILSNRIKVFREGFRSPLFTTCIGIAAYPMYQIPMSVAPSFSSCSAEKHRVCPVFVGLSWGTFSFVNICMAHARM